MAGDDLSILNQARKTLPGVEYLHDLINWSCDSAIAIDFWTDSGKTRHISYKLLGDLTSALAQRIAETLRAAGASIEDAIVPVLISQSPELYISWIAILKAGAAFCPIAIDTPVERVKFILQDVSASLVLTTARHETWLAEVAPDIAILAVSQSSSHSTSRSTPLKGEDEVQKTALQPQSLAYIMYTSGSTGSPKGVKISHQAVCQALLAHDEHVPIFLRFLQFASPTFDVSVFETFFPLFRGATLVGRDRESMLADLPGTIRAMDVDAAELTPTVAGTLLKNREAAPCLRLLLTIGEMLSKPVITEFGGSATQQGILYAMYGPTEASIHCTIAAKMEVSSSIHNIGRPLATVTAVIIDASAEEFSSQHCILPMGQTGELAVAGQLASGYLNRPEQTTATFVDLPGYGLFYRTGDRARIVQDGTIEMLGRISSGQVKLRGQRVELGEIESVACQVDRVVMAAASIINDSLVLFCVLDGRQTTVANIRALCQKHLLSFMVPGDIVLLEQHDLPRLPSGKMDRKKIQDNYADFRKAKTHPKAGLMDAITAQMCKVVSDELGRAMSPTTSLRVEGIHSLLAIKIASSLRCKEIEVSVRDLLELETINEVAARVKERDAEVDLQALPTCTLFEDTEIWQRIRKTVKTTLGAMYQVEHIFPCTSIQVAMLTETISNKTLNFNSIELEFVSSLSFSDIRSAFQKIAQDNEILRSGFLSVDENLMPFVQIVWHELDLEQDLNLFHPLKITCLDGNRNRFLVQIHHVLYDGWSWDLIMADLNALLAEHSIPERPQFRDISCELRRLQHSRQDRAEDYWKGLLKTAMPFHLPQLDAKLHSGSSQLVAWRPLQISSHVLAAFASRLHVSSQTIVAAALSLVLGSYAGSSDVIFGFVSSGRHLPVPLIENVIGPCLSALPLVIDLAAIRTTKDLVLYVHGLELDVLEYGTMSLRDIHATATSTSRRMLFDTLFAWQETLPSVERTKGLVKTVETRDCLDYALVIEAEPSGDEIIIKLTYNTAKLSTQSVRNLSAHLDYLVTTIVTQEATSVLNVWNACNHNILAKVNSQLQSFGKSFDLTSTIRALVKGNPDKVAVSFAHDFDPVTKVAHREYLTYGELWARSNLMAHSLQGLDVGVDDIVAVFVEKSLDLYVLDLAIIISGGAFLNIDMRTPSDRIKQILHEVKCKLVITGDMRTLPSDSDLIGVRSLPLSALKSDTSLYRKEPSLRQEDIRGSQLAYAVMTSGTTGIPKAILITRKNLLSNIDILSKAYPLYNGQDVLLQACSPAFDVFVFELFWTWHMGLCLSATTNDILLRDIEGFIRASKISHLSLTPSVAALIHPDNVPGVKFLITAGEPMNSKVFSNWAGRGLFQGYGPAETTNICNVKGPVQRGDLINNVGPPFVNTSIFICAKQTEEHPGPGIRILPLGAVGEIVLGGEQVARGYANHDLTARSFIDTQYGRLYRSGDIGRLLANGDLILLGREDDQVKLRGQRIELGDVNTAISGLAFVKDAVTLIIDLANSNARLVSFWTAHGELQPSDPLLQIYEHLEAHLPDYMIPENVLLINTMPLTGQGKIDKNELVQHFKTLTLDDLQRLSKGAGGSDEQGDFMDHHEKLIAHALSEATKIPVTSIKPDTSFFSLGIDSVSAVIFSRKLRQANIGQVDISVILKNYSVRRLQRALLNHCSVSELKAQTLELDELFQPGWRAEVIEMAEAEGQMVEKIVPCNALQESILFSQTNNPSSTTYEAHLEFEVRGDINRLRNAWSLLIERHQILRTGFAITPSARYAYAQVVLKEYKLPLFTSEHTASLYSMKFKDYISPPWRLRIDKPASGRYGLLTLIMSHALYDSEALAILLREAELICNVRDLAATVSPDAYSRYMLSMNLDRVDAFWQSQLSGYNPRSFTSAFRTGKLENSLQRTYIYTSKISGKILQSAAENFLATTSSIFQAAWARLLSCYLSTEDVVFGNVFSGRNLPIEGIERMAAPLFNTLPLRVRVGGRRSMRALTATIKTTMLEILPFQPSPLRRIIRNQKTAGQPLFDTLVLIQSQDLHLDENIWGLRKEEGNMDFPGLIVEIVPSVKNDTCVFKLHVQSNKLDAVAAAQILSNYDTLLDEIVRYPQAQSNNYESIQANLPLLHATRTENATPEDPLPTNEVTTTDEEPFSDLELGMRTLFAQFSGVDSFGIRKNTSIFELGLDSLHVVQIASEIRALGYDITGAVVLKCQTIERLAQACKETKMEQTSNRTSTFDLKAFDQKHRATMLGQFDILNEDLQAIRPCTSTQSGILSEFIASKGNLYFNSVVLELPTETDLTLLKMAWQIVMNRNEMLRTGFVALNTSENTYGMITYTEGAQDLPWLFEENVDNKNSAKIGEACLRNLHRPCWRLSLRKMTGSTCLEIHLLHSLYDANSLDGMLAEVAAIYQNRDLTLPNIIPVSPALCTVLDQSELSRKSSEMFWKELSAGVPPSKFPDLNIHMRTERDSVTTCMSSDSLLQELQIGCRRLGVNLQNFCQIAWARLLAAYTGDSKVVFGVVLSGRTLPANSDAFFPTINTVPFSIDVNDDIHAMLEKAAETNIGLYQHQFTPVTAIKRWLGIEGELYDTLLVLQTTQAAQRADRPWIVINERAAAEYAISMEVLPQSNGHLELRITTRSNVVPKDHATILLGQYEALLREVAQEKPRHSLISKRLQAIVAPEDEHIATGTRLLHDFVEATRAKSPTATALEFAYSIVDGQVEKQCWSYSQLNKESNKIAHLLVANQVKPGDFVAVCFEKCPEASFAILAVLKAGCAYVAIDPSAPIARKRFILDDASCKVLLTTSASLFSSAGGDKTIMLAVDDQILVQNQPTTNPVLGREVLPSDICYCLYTSGTTGQPKGCLITHASAVQAMLAFQRIFAGHWDKESRFLQFASFHFDVSVLEQYWSWSVGICVTSAPRDILFEDIPGIIDALQITHLDLTPSLARLLKPEQVPSLCRGVFIVGGEQVTQDIIDTWGDAGCLYNFYGPSEVTIGCTVHKRVKKGVKATNIGQPWDNVGAFVLNPGSETPVLRGAVGELCLSGPLVGKGYLNRPGLTAEKFVTLTEYNIRVYRSGDLVRLLHDDSFEFMGRIDDQFKLRGQRLEIREIDHAIKHASDSIIDVATMIVNHADQPSKQLIAFFTMRGKTTKSAKISALTSPDADGVTSKVRRHLQDSLPMYMVPAQLLPISHIPLSANNKADLKALKAYFVAIPVRSLQNMDWNGSRIVPMTATIQKTISILATFLGVSDVTVSPSSRLFELGLDSISAVAFASVLRKEGFKGADAATVMRRPVVADLAHELDALEGDDYEQAVDIAKVNIESFRKIHTGRISSIANIESFWPCTPLQEDMLSKTVHRGDTPYYLSAFHYKLDSSVSLDALRHAWREAQMRFSILRTIFVDLQNKRYAQVVLQHCETPVLQVFENGEDILRMLDRRASTWSQKVDVLGKDPSWEVEVLETSKGERYLSLRIFHGLYDANSLSLMLKQVATAIRTGAGISAKENLHFHEALSYGPLCHRVGAEDFWTSNFSSPVLLDPIPIVGRLEKTLTTYSIEHTLPEAFIATKKHLAVTESAIFLAAYLLSLHGRYGIFPTFGMVISGRGFPLTGVEEICGPLFNTVPVQILPKEDWSHSDLINACHDFSIGAKPFEHTSLGDIRRWAGVAPGKALFDSLFVFQKENRKRANMGQDLWREIGQNSTPDYPLNIEVELRKDSFQLTIVVDPEFLEENDLQSISLKFSSVIECLVQRPYELLLPKEGYLQGDRRAHSKESPIEQGAIDRNIMDQVKLQVALLARQEIHELSDDVNLFSLGLDSISLIKLSSILKKSSLPISVNMIMRLSTTVQIARYLTERRKQSVTPQDISRIARNQLVAAQIELRGALKKQHMSLDRIEKVLPVTPMQEGVLANFEKYYHFALLKLSSSTDLDRLRSAWESAVMLHPVLRTSFVAIDDPDIKHTFAQLIMTPSGALCEIKAVEHESQIQRIVEGKSCEMLGAGLRYPSFTIDFLIVADKNNRYVLLGMSHAIYDGWSIQLLHQDVASLYQGQQIERPPVDAYLQYISSRSLDAARRFWTQQMSHFLPKPVPALESDQATGSTSHRMTIQSRLLSSTIQRFCMDHSITVQTLGLSTWATVLSTYLKTRDISFGVVLACRDTEDADQLMFPTFNTVPFRPRFEGASCLDLLKHIQLLSVQIADHQDFPLKEIKKFHSGASGHSAELFDTLFVLQRRTDSDQTVSQLYEEIKLGESPQLDYPVNVEMDLGNSLRWTVAASGSVLSAEGVNVLIESLERTLEAILLESTAPVMGFHQAEHGPEIPSTQTTPAIPNEVADVPIQETDATLRTTVFDTFASVARCSVESLSGETNIYSLGLDSISVIKVMGLLRKKDISLSVSKIVAAVTLDRIAGEARRTKRLDAIQMPTISSVSVLPEEMQNYFAALGVDKSAIETVLPASAGQIFMLDHYRASQGTLFYATFRYKISNGSVSNEQIVGAWDAVMQVFPALRTRFVERDGQIWQVVIKSDFVSRYPTATLLTVSQEHGGIVIELQLHHALYDAVSLPIIIAAFEKACQGQSIQLPNDSRIEHSRAQELLIAATRGDATKTTRREFWTEYLGTYTQISRSARTVAFVAKRIEAYQENAISSVDTRAMADRAATEGVSLQALFIAAVARVYAAHIHPPSVDTIVLGVYLANRGLEMKGVDLDLQNLAHPTVNIVPLVVSVSGELVDCAKRVQGDLARVQEVRRCGVNLREVWEWSGERVRVEWCVNFLPGGRGAGESIEGEEGNEDEDMYGDGDGGEMSRKVKLLPFPYEKRGDAALGQRHIRDLTSPFFTEPSGSVEEMPWCVPSVDVEAKLESGGGLTVGVFAPEDALGGNEEEGAVERVLREVRDVLKLRGLE